MIEPSAVTLRSIAKLRMRLRPLDALAKSGTSVWKAGLSRLDRLITPPLTRLPFGLVAAIVLPVLLFAVVVSLLLDRKDRSAIEQQLDSAARSASAAINLKLADQLATLETIAAAIDIAEAVDSAGLREARRVLDAEPDWLGLRLIDPHSGQSIVSLGRGAQGEFSGDAEDASGKQIGDVTLPHKGDVPKYVPLQVYVRRDGKNIYLLTAHVRAGTFGDVLNTNGLPSGWTSGVLDDKHQLVSRTPDGRGEAVSQRASRSVAELIKGRPNSMVFFGDMLGRPMYFAFRTARFSGWTTFVGAPAEVIEAPLRRHRALMFGAGAMAVLLTLFLAATLWRSAARLREESALVSHKDVLLREINHRIKNNLQIICSLVSLQADRAPLPQQRELQTIVSRVRALSLVHEQLHPRLPEGVVDLSAYLEHLASNLLAVHGWAAQNIRLVRDLQTVTVKADLAASIGLIVNEAVTNSLKHAFPHGCSGTIRIALEPNGVGGACLEITDDGVGLPQESTQDQGVGLSLIEMLAGQTRGQIRWETSRGTSLHLNFDAGACVDRAWRQRK